MYERPLEVACPAASDDGRGHDANEHERSDSEGAAADPERDALDLLIALTGERELEGDVHSVHAGRKNDAVVCGAHRWVVNVT